MPQFFFASSSSSANNQAVVGWPPNRAFWMNSLINLSKAEPDYDTPRKANQKGRSIGFSNGHSLAKGQEKSRLSSGCLFVKVNMDVERKFDFNSHCSYESLAISLELIVLGNNHLLY
ncbi:auxin-responsive protein IAA10-like [Carex rostrata]